MDFQVVYANWVRKLRSSACLATCACSRTVLRMNSMMIGLSSGSSALSLSVAFWQAR